MNALSYVLALVPAAVQGIETLVGDKAAGTTKAQMAQDMLSAAANGASSVLSGNNAVYGQAAATVAQLAINQFVTVSQASGAYQKWTAAAQIAQQDAGVAQAVGDLIKSVQTPQNAAPTAKLTQAPPPPQTIASAGVLSSGNQSSPQASTGATLVG